LLLATHTEVLTLSVSSRQIKENWDNVFITAFTAVLTKIGDFPKKGGR